ncbi:uncharacterized protein LOC134267917 [Saccostrea cucullata]|uniref:uncharacterized protein LOC134267917 n=1 Tax=Saccostrea cuccullata TaxID=36930 RepID=UPI002ED34E0F
MKTLMRIFPNFLLSSMLHAFSEYMIANVKLDNFRFDDELLQTIVQNDVADCSLQCLETNDCLSVQYRKTTGDCRLYNTVFLSTDGGIAEQNWRYFQKTGGYCPSYFTRYGRNGLCFHYAGELAKDAGIAYCSKMESGLIPVTSARVEAFIESLLERTTVINEKSAYIQGRWNTTHWTDNQGRELQYTKWKAGLGVPPAGKENIKIIRTQGGYFWTYASSGRNARSLFCGLIID